MLRLFPGCALAKEVTALVNLQGWTGFSARSDSYYDSGWHGGNSFVSGDVVRRFVPWYSRKRISALYQCVANVAAAGDPDTDTHFSKLNIFPGFGSDGIDWIGRPIKTVAPASVGDVFLDNAHSLAQPQLMMAVQDMDPLQDFPRFNTAVTEFWEETTTKRVQVLPSINLYQTRAHTTELTVIDGRYQATGSWNVQDVFTKEIFCGVVTPEFGAHLPQLVGRRDNSIDITSPPFPLGTINELFSYSVRYPMIPGMSDYFSDNYSNYVAPFFAGGLQVGGVILADFTSTADTQEYVFEAWQNGVKLATIIQTIELFDAITKTMAMDLCQALIDSQSLDGIAWGKGKQLAYDCSGSATATDYNRVPPLGAAGLLQFGSPTTITMKKARVDLCGKYCLKTTHQAVGSGPVVDCTSGAASYGTPVELPVPADDGVSFSISSQITANCQCTP